MEFDEISRAIGSIEAGIKDIKEDNAEFKTEIKALLEAHDNRIKDLEVYKNQMIGKISVIAIICGAIGWGITTAISYFYRH